MGPGPGVVIGSMFFKDFCRIFYARNVSETEKQCCAARWPPAPAEKLIK